MIRPTTPEDTPQLLTISEGTGVFSPSDMAALREVLDDYHAEAKNYGHCSVTYEQHGQVIGFAYYAPAAMTDRTWELWWIVVSKQIQARGVGGQLLKHAEDAIRGEDGRLLILDTSSLPSYELTRKFYLKHGYYIAAVLKDFYADGHDKVVYGKRLGT
ncbi:MAG: GNAT family N-acetyltransferase [Gemmataceae bacterium]